MFHRSLLVPFIPFDADNQVFVPPSYMATHSHALLPHTYASYIAYRENHFVDLYETSESFDSKLYVSTGSAIEKRRKRFLSPTRVSLPGDRASREKTLAKIQSTIYLPGEEGAWGLESPENSSRISVSPTPPRTHGHNNCVHIEIEPTLS